LSDVFPSYHLLIILPDDFSKPVYKFDVVFLFCYVCLIATDVQVRSRRHRRKLTQHIVDELECNVAVKLQGTKTYFDARVDLRRLAVRVQFTVRSQGCIGMTRHVDFRDDGYEAVGRILYNFRILFLRVISALAAADRRRSTMCSKSGP